MAEFQKFHDSGLPVDRKILGFSGSVETSWPGHFQWACTQKYHPRTVILLRDSSNKHSTFCGLGKKDKPQSIQFLASSLPFDLKLQDSNIPWDKVYHGMPLAVIVAVSYRQDFWANSQSPDDGVVRQMLMATKKRIYFMIFYAKAVDDWGCTTRISCNLLIYIFCWCCGLHIPSSPFNLPIFCYSSDFE